MQHHLRIELFKDGVYDPRNAIQTSAAAVVLVHQHFESLYALKNQGRL